MSQFFRPRSQVRTLKMSGRPGGLPTASHNVYLDANVFGKLMTIKSNPTTFIMDSLAVDGGREPDYVNIITSPFALFEYLGIKVPKPEHLVYQKDAYLKQHMSIPLHELLVAARDFYLDSEKFDLSALEKRYIEMRPLVSKEAVGLLDSLVKSFVRPDRLTIIAQMLAWDYVSNIQIPSAHQEKYYYVAMYGVVPEHTRGFNFSFARFAAEAMKNRIKPYLKENENSQAKEAFDALSFKTKGDHMDRELLHYAMVGWHFNTGIPLTTHCFTADPADKTIIRASNIARIYSEHFYNKKIIANYKKEFPNLLKPKPGKILCFELNSLKLLKTIDCKNLMDPTRWDLELLKLHAE